MSDLSDDQRLQKELAAIYPPKTATRIATLRKDKPQGWSRKSSAPYYRKEYAEWIRPHVDRMITDGKHLLFQFRSNQTKMTLYQKLNQAIRFLLEQLDPTDRYNEWWDAVSLKKETEGYVIRYKTDMEISVVHLDDNPANDVPTWRHKLTEWLESPSQEPFVLKTLLSQEQKDALEIELSSLSVQASISFTEIKVIKV